MDKKKLTAALMTVAITGSSFTAFADFKDVQDGDLKEKIQALVDAGIISGKGNGIFDPAGNMKRGELAKVIALALELPLDKAGAEKKFADVKGHWSAPYVGALVKAGITNGVAPNKFNPEGTVTRQELAVFFIRALGLEDEAEGLALLPQYDDAASIAEWAKFEVALAQALGLTAEEGNFGPNVKASRTEMVEYTYASAFAQEEIAQAVEEIEKIVADLDDIEAAEAAVKAFVEAKLTTEAEVKAAEELLAKANEAIAKVDSADKKAELQKQVDDQKAKLDDAKVEVAVKAYEDAKLTTLEEVTAAEELGKKAEEAVAKVADATKKAAFEKRVADQKAKVDAAKASLNTLVVESASAVNLLQIEVKFNKELDATSATNVANYTYTGATTISGSPVLKADGKTVLITLTASEAQQATATLAIANVKDKNGNTVASTTKTVTFLDTTLPTVVSAAVTAPTKVQITFSEPVTAGAWSNAAFSLDNNTYSLTGVPTLVAPNVVELTLPSALPEGQHKITVNPTGTGAPNLVKDHAGFSVAASDVTFNYVADTTAPVATLTSATQTQVVITLNKKITAPNLNGTGLTVYHSYNNQAAYKGNAALSLDGKTLTVTFTAPLPTGTTTIYLNPGTGVDQAVDDWGNKLQAATLSATVTADTTAPTVTSVAFVNNTTIDVTFSEPVVGISASDFTLKDSTGAAVTVSNVVNTSGNTYRLTTGTLTGGTYTLSIAAGSITDNALTPNSIAAYSTTLNITDTVAPTVTAAGSFNSARTKVFISFSEKMATSGAGSVLDVNNYRFADALGGNVSALPAGTTISLGADGKSVVINLPAANAGLGAGNFAQVLVGQVRDVAGNPTTALSSGVTISAANIQLANITNVQAISTDTITFVVDRALSAINVNNFKVNNVAATYAAYANNADGTATVTVKTGTPFATDLSDLNANAVELTATGAITDVNGTTNSAGFIIPKAHPVADKVAPKITGVTTVDNNGNGKIDEIDVTFSEALYIASVQDADFTVAGYTVTALSLDPTQKIVKLVVNENTITDGGATPTVALTGSVEDAARNVLTTASVPATADGVKPVIVAVNRLSATEVAVTFSEALKSATVLPAAFTITTADGSDVETVTNAVLSADGKTVTLTAAGANIATNDTVTVNNTVTDNANNANNTTTPQFLN